MKILLTGATGFIGKHLSALLEGDHELFLIKHPRNQNEKISENEIICDLSSPLDIKTLPSRIDVVIHLAQSNNFRSFPKGSIDMVSVNILSTINLLEYARKAGCSQFINMSTGSVYSDLSRNLFESELIRPKGMYSVTKYSGELLVESYSDIFSALNLRLFFPYGPQQKNMFMPNLINRIKDGIPVTIQGSGEGMILTPIFVSDVCKIISSCIDNQNSGIMNLAGQEVLSIKEISTKISDLVGAKVEFTFELDKQPPKFSPDLKKLNQHLGDFQYTKIDDGLHETIKSMGLLQNG